MGWLEPTTKVSSSSRSSDWPKMSLRPVPTRTTYVVRPWLRPWIISVSPQTLTVAPGRSGMITSCSAVTVAVSSGLLKRMCQGVKGAHSPPQPHWCIRMRSGPYVRNEKV